MTVIDLAESRQFTWHHAAQSLLPQLPRPPLEGEERGEGGAFALTLALSRKWERVRTVLWSKLCSN
jgi:hypothetical protein